MQYFIASAKTKTIQAALTITGAATGSVTVASTTGWETGDLALISAVAGATGVNGLAKLSITNGTTILVTDPVTGATKTFGGSYTSGGTITHVGFQTAALTLDNTVFANPNPDFTLKTNIQALSAAAAVRIQAFDTGDAFAADIKPGPCVFSFGAQVSSAGVATPAFRRYDWPGLRIGNANNAMRSAVYLEGANGAAPAVGSSVTWSTWIEA